MAAAPPVLDELISRFDPSAFDAPAGRARLRLRVDDVGDWDLLVGPRGGCRLEPADDSQRPDARRCADPGPPTRSRW
jgi:hypothetical protein